MSVGTSPLLWVFVGELIPPEYKVLSGFITFMATSFLFTVAKMFPLLLQLLSPHGTYWLFSGVAMSANMFYYFCVPETKGKSLLEIQQGFSKNY